MEEMVAARFWPLGKDNTPKMTLEKVSYSRVLVSNALKARVMQRLLLKWKLQPLRYLVISQSASISPGRLSKAPCLV